MIAADRCVNRSLEGSSGHNGEGYVWIRPAYIPGGHCGAAQFGRSLGSCKWPLSSAQWHLAFDNDANTQQQISFCLLRDSSGDRLAPGHQQQDLCTVVPFADQC